MKKTMIPVLASGLAISLGLGGCASTATVDQLRSEIQAAQSTADTARQEAAEANRTAMEAKTTAEQAQKTANDAAAAAHATDARIDRMFKKAMQK